MYDNAGRLVQVIAADGSSAEYEYDAAGNITAIRRFASSDLALVAFAPASGAVGAAVTIRGSGFSTTPSANAVSFNGVAAAVLSGSANSLSVQVPPGATTGVIAVTVAGNSVMSAQDFLVVSGPAISGFSPGAVNAGGSVTLTGTNLNPLPGSTQVAIGGASGQLTSTAATQLTFRVSAAARTSPITVRTPHGDAVSATSLIVLPPAISAANVSASGQLSTGGSAVPLSIGANMYGLLAFPASQGEYLSIQTSAITTTPSGAAVNYQVYSPSETVFASGTVSSSNPSIHLPQIATSGTYLVAFSAGTAALSISASLEVSPVFSPAGAPLSVSTGGARQSKRFIIEGSAGQHIGVAVSNLGLTPNVGNATLQILKPDGGVLDSASCGTAGPCANHLFNLPQTGTYRVIVTHSNATVMSFTLTVSQAATGALSIGTPMTVNLPIQGQFGVYTFSATAGQTVAVNLKSIVTNPAGTNIFFVVRGPNGTQIAGDGHSSNLTYNLTNLAAGSYTVQVSPYFGVTASAELTVANGVTAILPVNGSSNSFSTAVPAQAGYFTFSGTAGQHIGVALSNLSLTPNVGSATLQVFKPDGGQLGSASCATSGPCAHHLYSLPQTGTYAVRVTPSSVTVMSFTLTVSEAVTGALSLGTPMAVNLPIQGQFGVFTFTASAGQTVAVNLKSIVTNPAGTNIWFVVHGPNGTQVAASGHNSNITYNLTNLAAGTYKVQVSPFFGVTASAELTVANGLTATLPVDGTSNNFSTAVPAQVGYFTFSGTAGQHIGVALSNLSLTPNAGSATLQVFKPDGGQLASTSCSTAGPCAHHLFNLPQTDTYAVRVTPPGTATMSFTLNVSNAVTGSLSAGTPLSVSLPIFGQFGVYSFSATAGQSLAVTVNSIATSPAGNNLWIAVYNPSNVAIAGSGGSSSVTHNLSNLPAGTYKVTVMPYFGVTASAQVSYQ